MPGRIPARLELLRKKRAHWLAVRAARKALFARPTPIANRLRAFANLHRFIDYAYVIVSTLIGARFLWRLVGGNDTALFYRVLEQLTTPLIRPFATLLTPIRVGPHQWLELAELAAVLALGLAVQLLNWLVTVVAHRKPFA